MGGLFKGLRKIGDDIVASFGKELFSIPSVEETTVVLDNGITGTAVFRRTGDVVTMTGTTSWTHSSSSSISTSTGIIPERFLPIDDIWTLIYCDTSLISRLHIDNNGQFELAYFDSSLAAVAATTTTTIPHITYVVTG